jgi:PiT family inorganic phosphate transporter
LIGGLMGAALADAGPSALNGLSILKKVILPLILSPLGGFAVGFSLMTLVTIIFFRFRRQSVNRFFGKAQVCSAAFMALTHGLNDAQKTMGVITLALLIFGQIEYITVPFWVKLSCALAMGAGTGVGGWKIVKTMGHKIFKLETVHGASAETSAALVIACASVVGAPVSTTQTITACIFGVGSTKRFSAVRWGVVGNLIIAWIFTIPASACVSALFFFVLDILFKGL